MERYALGEIVTGLIYADSTGEELHRYLNTVETPLNQLGVAELSVPARKRWRR